MTDAVVTRPKYSFGPKTIADQLGLLIAGELTADEWIDVVRKVAAIDDASKWWLGDILAYGEYRYGEKYTFLLEELDRQFDQVRDYAYVSGNVPRRVREIAVRTAISWTHFRAVAKLVPDEQEVWIRRAIAEGWSKRTLLEELAGSRAPSLEAGESVTLEQIRFTIAPDRAERWKAAAERDGQDFSDWAADVLDRAAA